jgi:ribosomal protein S18 acetylase RimI-like enzyme
MQIEHEWLAKISMQGVAFVPDEDIKDMNRLVHQLSPKAPTFTARKLTELRHDADVIVLRDAGVRAKGSTVTDPWRHPIIAMSIVVPMHLPQGLRMHIEGVVVDEKYRGRGVERLMMECIEASALMCSSERLQLTSSRPDAQKMYLKLGYTTPKSLLFRKSL